MDKYDRDKSSDLLKEIKVVSVKVKTSNKKLVKELMKWIDSSINLTKALDTSSDLEIQDS